METSKIDKLYDLIQSGGVPVYYKDAICKVLGVDANKMNADMARRISHLYTEMNMDARFDFMGKGMWGLAAWTPKEKAVKRSKKSKKAKSEVQEIDSDMMQEEEDNYNALYDDEDDE